MKIQKLSIDGIHAVSKKKTYEFSDINYVYGSNGSGKSTILQAIQLSLLGYIPGTNKSNIAIMEHAAGKTMDISLTLEDDDKIYKIVNEWMGAGKKVTKSVTVESKPSDLYEDVEELRTDIVSNTELPIFNFSEFMSMTPNKLKEWFIDFLPESATKKINWKKTLSDSLKSDGIPIDADTLKSALNFINNLDSKSSELDKCKEFNDYCKSELSNTRAKIKQMESSISTAIMYDDDDLPSDINEIHEMLRQLSDEIAACREQRDAISDEISNYNIAKSKNESSERLIKSYEQKLSEFDKDSYLSEMELLENKIKKNEELCNQGATTLNATKKEKLEFLEESEELRQNLVNEIALDNSVLSSSGVCPITNTVCEILESKSEDSEKHKNEALKKLEELDSKRDAYDVKISKCKSAIDQLSRETLENSRTLASVRSEFNSMLGIQDQINDLLLSISPLPEISASITDIEKLDAKADEATSLMAKLQANLKYQEMIDNMTSTKLTLENDVEIYKNWSKETGENGIQNKLLEKPFIELESNMNSLLKEVFKSTGRNLEVKFKLSKDSNSFDIGVIEDDTFVSYNLLSSGEKTLFTFVLMVSIVNMSNTKLKLLLIDDILDHLDDKNIDNLFEVMKTIKDVQIIMAGVKECRIDGINIIEP